MDLIGMKRFTDVILTDVVSSEEELGRGAYGRVYKVNYRGKPCAAKEIHTSLVRNKVGSRRIIESFLRECQRCQTLRHPNIVRFVGVYYPSEGDTPKGNLQLQRLPTMVMELMASNLSSFVEQTNTIHVDVKFSIICDVASGLCYLHSQRPPVVHRDLSPNNILLTTSTASENPVTAKIGDFGVSKVLQDSGVNTTAPGTLDFMPPEALKAGSNYDCSLDVFSFAGIILHTFTQKWPRPSVANDFNPKTRELFALSEIQRRKMYIDMIAEKDASLKRLIQECLDQDPARRPSMKVVLEKIDRKNVHQVVQPSKHEKVENLVKKQNKRKNTIELYKKMCRTNGNPDNHDNNGHKKFHIYILEPDKTSTVADGVFECTYGTALVQQATSLLPEKVVMLIGATGTGKSTLINRLVNHIFGVKYTDNFRFQLTVEQGLSQTVSQTKCITKYIIYKSNLLYKLVIIDTPGLGDTGGEKEDEKNISRIKNLFESNTIQSIDAICFVSSYNDQRLTSYLSYILYKVVMIFGVNVYENFFVMATFCDSVYDKNNCIKPAPTLITFQAADIPFKNSFPFNNKDIFMEPVDKSHKTLNYSYWKTSSISFALFFHELDQTLPVSLTTSRDILIKQHNILHAQLPDFVRKLKKNVHMIDECLEDLNAIKSDIENSMNPGFTYKVTVEKEVMEDIDEPDVYCSRCEKCDRVCHYPCTIGKDGNLWWCKTISWFNLQFRMHCIVCEDKCSWKDHKCYKQRPVRRTVEEVRTNDYLKQKYLSEPGDTSGDLRKSCEEKMVSVYGALLKDLESIQQCIDFISNKCLSKVSTTPEKNISNTTLEKYISDIIQKEREDREDGFIKRITVLENLITSMKKADIYEDFKKASNEEKVQLAKQCFKGIC